jgi:transcriptional regulator with XRE-family HTH domain
VRELTTVPLVTSTSPRERKQVLGGAAKQIRLAKKKTQAEIATKAGFHFAVLSMIENGKRQPSYDVICRLAAALEVEPDDISYWATIYVVDEDVA